MRFLIELNFVYAIHILFHILQYASVVRPSQLRLSPSPFLEEQNALAGRRSLLIINAGSFRLIWDCYI